MHRNCRPTMTDSKGNIRNGSGNGSLHDNNDEPIVAMPTSALESKLRTLREKSNQHSQVLTQKLASSQSGQNLLHIGTSLSTLPPDLHSLLTQLHPVLSAAETTEQQQLQKLQSLVQHANEIRSEQRRMVHASECADLYQDLLAAERDAKRDAALRRNNKSGGKSSASVSFALAVGKDEEDGGQDSSGTVLDELDHVLSLERAAHTTLCLVQDLQSSNAQVTAMTTAKATGGTDAKGSATSASLPSLRSPLEDDTERAQLLLKLAPRIRRLESDSITSLSHRMEEVLNRMRQLREQDPQDGPVEGEERSESELLLMLGCAMRGLALLGRGKEVESVFARVAIMPLIRSKVSMGRLDEGGSRGECAGLFTLMDDITTSITNAFGPVLRLVETIFQTEMASGSSEGTANSMMGVDLVTAGVWVPIATALMADAGIKMAIFSPGIASILQSNYIALDTFLEELAERLLTATEDSDGDASKQTTPELSPTMNVILDKGAIQAAQDRIYTHPKTAEFSKKWNLPIYYQLRFGECCNRLNKAVTQTEREGWIADVFTGPQEELEKLKNMAGFELPLFLELYDILLGLWKPDVILRPLTHRFLRGSIQLVGRTISFIGEGMEGKIKFGEIRPDDGEEKKGSNENVNEGDNVVDAPPVERPLARKPYCWGESEGDVGAVAWELTILESTMAHEYVDTVVSALSRSDTTEAEESELRTLASEVLKDASEQINPIIDSAWNTYIVNILTAKCSGPLAAVKGVAATYRMTNRPPPTQASPFVGTILRPLKDFHQEFASRTPDRVGSKWKEQVVVTVADRYSVAVEELIATVQRTEVALKNRKARRTAVGGMSDGEKVKLQLFLDYKTFSQHVQEIGVDPSVVKGVDKLRQLTIEAEGLLERQQNGSK